VVEQSITPSKSWVLLERYDCPPNHPRFPLTIQTTITSKLIQADLP